LGKKNMSDTTEQIASVIDLTNQLEVQINLALSECILPVSTEYGFLRETLFHNLCLGFGAKVRLLQRILDYWNWKETKLDDFHKLMQLRNAFAHTPTTKRVLLVGVDDETVEHHPLGSQLVVDRKYKTYWQEVERGKAFQDFFDSNEACLSIVKEIAQRIKTTLRREKMVKKFSDNPTHPLRALQIWQILIGAAKSRQILTYGILADMLGYKGAGVFAQPLGHIMYYCQQNKLPPLTIIVVNQDTGIPGTGLTGADLSADRESVFRFDWYGLIPPSPEDLRIAYQNGEAQQQL
jgi:putative restriction endonuclease